MVADHNIGAAFHNARSPVYNHYDISVDHIVDQKGNKVQIDFIFLCKLDPTGHFPHHRSRLKASAGTGNLVVLRSTPYARLASICQSICVCISPILVLS
jgi:hypothetical protein